MKRSKALIGGLCIAVAVAVGVGQWYLVNVASTAAVPVVCAKTDIPAGTKITGDMLEIKKMGKLNLPSSIIGDTAKSSARMPTPTFSRTISSRAESSPAVLPPTPWGTGRCCTA